LKWRQLERVISANWQLDASQDSIGTALAIHEDAAAAAAIKTEMMRQAAETEAQPNICSNIYFCLLCT
jgi:hypothetical protein